MKRTVILFLLLALGLTGAAHAAVSARILSPVAQQPVFGATEVLVEVTANEAVSRVEVFLNGKLAGTATAPPFKVTVDVGEENVAREFKAVVHGASGATGSAVVVTEPVRIDDVMEVNLRQLFVTVTRGGEDGRRILSLEQDDFEVYDNGKRQEVVTFGKGEVPVSAMLLVDTSESMQGERLEAARRGVKAFLGGMLENDEAGLVLFSDRLLGSTPFSGNPQVLNAAIGQVEASGGTAVNDFLYMALKRLEPRAGRRVIILLSDGSDVHSVLSMEDVLWKARASQAIVYWIQLEGGEKHQSYSSAWRTAPENDREYANLKKTIEETGGRILPINRPGEIEFAFANVMTELREQYVIGFYPTDAKKDGRWHEIKVKVPNRSGIKARVREGYVDN